jgi:hypothetical protein
LLHSTRTSTQWQWLFADYIFYVLFGLGLQVAVVGTIITALLDFNNQATSQAEDPSDAACYHFPGLHADCVAERLSERAKSAQQVIEPDGTLVRRRTTNPRKARPTAYQ